MIVSTASRALVAAALASLALAGTACRDSTSPPSIAHYVLERVGEEAVPLVLHTDAGEETVLLGEELALLGDGTGWRRTFTGRRPVGSTAVPGPDETVPVALIYRETGGELEIAPAAPCPVNALCIGPDIARRTATGLAVESDRFALRELHFRQVVLED